MKNLKDLLKNKKYHNSDEQKILSILKDQYQGIKNENISLHNGILSFNNIPSAFRLEMMLNKRALLERINKKGVYLRDIL